MKSQRLEKEVFTNAGKKIIKISKPVSLEERITVLEAKMAMLLKKT